MIRLLSASTRVRKPECACIKGSLSHPVADQGARLAAEEAAEQCVPIAQQNVLIMLMACNGYAHHFSMGSLSTIIASKTHALQRKN